ncbi:MAG: phosphotransferase [Candidatus Saccharibacteria bacterium]
MAYKKTGQFIAQYETIALFLKQYSITNFTYSKAKKGIENTTLIINTNTKKYVLRIYRYAHKNDDEILLELGFMHELKLRSLPVPTIYSNIAGKLLTHESINGLDWQAILMEFCEGYHADTYTNGLIVDFATRQANMHIAGIDFASNNTTQQKITELVETEFIHLIPQKSLNEKGTKALIERAESFKVSMSLDLPYGYSHFDFDIENVLVDNSDHIKAILDFDDIRYGPLVMCLAYTLWQVLFSTDSPKMVQDYLKSYEKIRPLDANELMAIAPIMLFRHYVLASLTQIRNELIGEKLERYLKIEKFLKQVSYS